MGAKITMTVVFAMVLVSVEAVSAPSLTVAEQSVFDQAVDDTTMPDESFDILIPHLIKWFQNSTDQVRDDSLPLVSVRQLLGSPSSSRGLLHRVEGRLEDQRSMPPPHEQMEEWFIRLSSGEPLALYLPVGQIEVAAGELVELDARFYKVLKTRAMDGQIRRYPVFLTGRAGIPSRLDSRKTWQQMDVLMLLGFMLLLAVVLIGVMLLARRQLPSERRMVVPMVDAGNDLPDDPAAALRELRSRAGGEQT